MTKSVKTKSLLQLRRNRMAMPTLKPTLFLILQRHQMDRVLAVVTTMCTRKKVAMRTTMIWETCQNSAHRCKAFDQRLNQSCVVARAVSLGGHNGWWLSAHAHAIALAKEQTSAKSFGGKGVSIMRLVHLKQWHCSSTFINTLHPSSHLFLVQSDDSEDDEAEPVPPHQQRRQQDYPQYNPREEDAFNRKLERERERQRKVCATAQTGTVCWLHVKSACDASPRAHVVAMARASNIRASIRWSRAVRFIAFRSCCLQRSNMPSEVIFVHVSRICHTSLCERAGAGGAGEAASGGDGAAGAGSAGAHGAAGGRRSCAPDRRQHRRPAK